jgi:hypothetical protein
MAKRARRTKSKTELIREYIAAHPDESARSVAKTLNASPALVYRVKGGTTGGPVARRGSTGYDGVILAARLIAVCGNVKAAHNALLAAAEISQTLRK